MSEKKSGYAEAGVDVNAADAWVEGIASTLQESARSENAKQQLAQLKSGVGAYAAVYASSPQQWVAASCDGVGTKILWTAQGLGSPRDMAQDLLAMNANDVLCVGAKPALFLDYIAHGNNALLKKGELLQAFIKGLSDVCVETGQLLVGGETAQMPDLYQGRHFDLAGFSIGFMNPQDHLHVDLIESGAEVWGWTSNGPHANGFSWLRRLFDAQKDADFISRELMKPTRLYVNEFLDLRQSLAKEGPAGALQGAYHITGSGLLNLLRAQPKGRALGFDLQAWPKDVPSWVKAVADRSKASPAELYSSFNMGIGFMVILSPAWTRALGQKGRSLLESKGLQFLGKSTSEACVRVGGVELK